MFVKGKDLNSGYELIDPETSSRLSINDVEESSVMPGFIKIENPFGVLYVDPEQEFEVILS